MLTSYSVSCPHVCGWRGSLLPKGNGTAFRGCVPTVPMVEFECPHCHKEWRARIVNDDVVNLPLEKMSMPSA
ncbi:MAG: hypothetical protein ACK4RK_07300 [Gemmataceae bacterium]